MKNWAIEIGRHWFRYRSFSPLPLIPLLFLLTPDFSPSPLAYALIVIGICLGESIRLWAVGYAGSATRTRGETVPQLVHAGPYRWVRNPIYIGNIILYLSVSLLFGFLYLTTFAFIYFVVQYSFIIRFEESVLQKTFGTAYDTYCDKVSRWLSKPPVQLPPSPHPYRFLAALRSDRTTIILIVVVLAVHAIRLQ